VRLLIKRRLRRRFFWFLAYSGYELLAGGLRLVVAGDPHLYLRVYWLTEIGDVSLLIAAVAESFRNVFWEFKRLRWFVRTVWGCAGLALLYSLLKAWVFLPVHATDLVSVIIAVELTVDYSVSAIGILFFCLMLFFGMKERRWEMGVIAGFTFNASLEVRAPLTLLAFGTKFRLVTAWTPPIGYTVAELIWCIYLWRPEQRIASSSGHRVVGSSGHRRR
jgi:hypothetical protein